MTSTPIPAGVLTVDDESYGHILKTPVWALRWADSGVALSSVTADQRARLLSPRPDGATDDEVDTWLTDAMSVIHQHCNSDGSDDDHNDWVTDLANELERVVGPARYPRPPRHDGVPDDAVAEAVRLLEAATPGPWSWSKRSDRLSGGTNGYDDVMTAREYRDGPEVEVSDEDAELIAAAPTIIANLLALLGVPVPPYQPTPPEPEPADRWEQIVDAVHDDAAPVSEVRTGPIGLSEGDRIRHRHDPDVELIFVRDDGAKWLAEFSTGVREFVVADQWEPVPPDAETLADIVAELRATADACDIPPMRVPHEARKMRTLADRIEAAARPNADTITVERSDVAAVLSDIDEWMQYVNPDAEMKDSVRRLRAAAGLSVPSEGGES